MQQTLGLWVGRPVILASRWPSLPDGHGDRQLHHPKLFGRMGGWPIIEVCFRRNECVYDLQTLAPLMRARRLFGAQNTEYNSSRGQLRIFEPWHSGCVSMRRKGFRFLVHVEAMRDPRLFPRASARLGMQCDHEVPIPHRANCACFAPRKEIR
jgi:hypothetical protein